MLTNDCISCLSYTRVNKESLVASRFSEGKDQITYAIFRTFRLSCKVGGWYKQEEQVLRGRE
jgi:hypothetical protein